MQIDNTPAATERQLWNWKANVDGGKQKLQTAYDEIYENHGAPNEDKYIWTNAFQNYHRGRGEKYYRWTGKKWEVDPSRKSEYGKIVYNKYIQLGGGN